jgi:hypothetical protein
MVATNAGDRLKRRARKAIYEGLVWPLSKRSDEVAARNNSFTAAFDAMRQIQP